MLQVSKPPKVFYGWWIVTACFICSMATGIVGYGFTAFFNPIVQEFGWSYAAISLAASLRGAETGLLAPVLGFLVDRWGAKWILFAGGLLCGLGLILLARVSSLAQFYGAFIVIALGTSCCGSGVINPAINNWFRRNLGKATGILNIGIAAGGLLIPVIYLLIQSYGWRNALIIMGAVCIVICVPLSLIIKHKPEQYGYLPDGGPKPLESQTSNHKSHPSAVMPEEINIGLNQALKSRAFWHMTLAMTLQILVYMAVVNHIMPFLRSINIEGSTASFFAGSIPILSIIGRFGAGWLSDKFSSKQVTVGSFILVSIGTLLFDYGRDSTLWLLVLAIILFSIGVGCAVTLRVVLAREYFGLRQFATIFGVQIGIQCIGSVIGPYLGGLTFDLWKSYHYAWLLFTVLNIVSLALIATTPRVQIKAYAAEPKLN
jgi:MFS family permease